MKKFILSLFAVLNFACFAADSNLHFDSAISITPNPATVNLPVDFFVIASDGAVPIFYSWDFGDGSTGSGNAIEHVYPASGSYDITVKAYESCGCSISATCTVDVVDGSSKCKIFNCRLDLLRQNKDGLNLVAQISLPKKYDVGGRNVFVRIGDFSFDSKLNKSGIGNGIQVRSRGDMSILTLKVKNSSLRSFFVPNPFDAKMTIIPNQTFLIAVDGVMFGNLLDLKYISNGKISKISF